MNEQSEYTELLIEESIPLPNESRGKKSTKLAELAAKMRIGDSIGTKKLSTTTGLMTALKKLGRKGASRKMGEGFRVWRIS